jgi:hypothetical protein
VPNISGIQNQLALWFIEKQRPDGTVTHALVYLGPHEIDGKDEGHPSTHAMNRYRFDWSIICWMAPSKLPDR